MDTVNKNKANIDLSLISYTKIDCKASYICKCKTQSYQNLKEYLRENVCVTELGRRS